MIGHNEILGAHSTRQLNEAIKLRIPFSLVTRTINDGTTSYRLTWYFNPGEAGCWDVVRYNSWNIEAEGYDLVDDTNIETFIEDVLNRVYVLSDDMDLSEGIYPLWFN